MMRIPVLFSFSANCQETMTTVLFEMKTKKSAAAHEILAACKSLVAVAQHYNKDPFYRTATA